jgi:hypothetical protein
MIQILPNINVNLKQIPSENRFGAVRKHDIHTGIDIFCLPHSAVTAYEDGVIVNVCQFTGASVGSPWWRDTFAVLVEGESGVILYGEIMPHPKLQAWTEDKRIEVKQGDILGSVLQVLKRDKGKPMNMLHLELYEHGYRGTGAVWTELENKPEKLLNVEILFKKENYLKKLYEKVFLKN